MKIASYPFQFPERPNLTTFWMQEIMQQEEPEPHAAAQYPAAQQDGSIDWFDSHGA